MIRKTMLLASIVLLVGVVAPTAVAANGTEFTTPDNNTTEDDATIPDENVTANTSVDADGNESVNRTSNEPIEGTNWNETLIGGPDTNAIDNNPWLAGMFQSLAYVQENKQNMTGLEIANVVTSMTQAPGQAGNAGPPDSVPGGNDKADQGSDAAGENQRAGAENGEVGQEQNGGSSDQTTEQEDAPGNSDRGNSDRGNSDNRP